MIVKAASFLHENIGTHTLTLFLCASPFVHVRVALSLQRGKVFLEPDGELKLSAWKMYLINPGSVGQPRDRDPRASFLVYDKFNEKVDFYRTDYDMVATQEKIVEAGLPVELADRLAIGR